MVLHANSELTSIVDTQTLEVIGRVATAAPHQLSFGKFLGPDRPAANSTTVVEFYNPTLDHYFITGFAHEIEALDRDVHAGWGRTGQQFFAPVGNAAAKRVCRFYGLPSAGLDSHFYSADREECRAVEHNFGHAWLEETDNAFRIELPDLLSGACGPGTIPVWRLWNARADSNHRYTTNPTVRDAMRDRGFVAEGYGDQGTAMCAIAPR